MASREATGLVSREDKVDQVVEASIDPLPATVTATTRQSRRSSTKLGKPLRRNLCSTTMSRPSDREGGDNACRAGGPPRYSVQTMESTEYMARLTRLAVGSEVENISLVQPEPTRLWKPTKKKSNYSSSRCASPYVQLATGFSPSVASVRLGEMYYPRVCE